MPSKILLDTNILLDIALPGRPDHESALLLANEIAYNAGLTAYMAATSAKDVYYVLGRGGNEKAARDYLGQMLDFFELVAVDMDVCRAAYLLDEPDFEDCIIRTCAEQIDADCIISRDEGAYRRSTVRRMSAREYVDLFCDVESVDL